MKAELRKSLSDAISQFNSRRRQLLEAAYQNGGEDAVQKLEQEYDALRDAYFEILQRELDENNHLYKQLMSAAKAEVDGLTASIKQLNDINNVINLANSAINLLGRILIILGI